MSAFATCRHNTWVERYEAERSARTRRQNIALVMSPTDLWMEHKGWGYDTDESPTPTCSECGAAAEYVDAHGVATCDDCCARYDAAERRADEGRGK